MDKNSHQFKVFLDVQSGLPRQGPGNDISTLRALSICSRLPHKPEVLDIGCGPGMQTLALAKALDANILAIDINPDYLQELEIRANAADLGEQIKIINADMHALPVHEQSLDLIWAEGSAYILGFENALLTWRKLLKANGYIALSELVWLDTDPPAEVAGFFAGEYPAMTDIETNLATIRSSGYEPVEHFTLPDAAWWEHYYTPLEARLPLLTQKHAGDNEALEIVDMARVEIDMRRRYPEVYGYEFFIACCDRP